MVMLLIFWTFSANLPVFLKNQSCRLSWIICSYDGAWIQTNVCCISRSKCIKSQLKAWIWKEWFQLVINTSQCNVEEHKYILCTAVCVSHGKNIGIVGSVLLPTLIKAFVKLHYDNVYVTGKLPMQWDSDLLILS